MTFELKSFYELGISKINLNVPFLAQTGFCKTNKPTNKFTYVNKYFLQCREGKRTTAPSEYQCTGISQLPSSFMSVLLLLKTFQSNTFQWKILCPKTDFLNRKPAQKDEISQFCAHEIRCTCPCWQPLNWTFPSVVIAERSRESDIHQPKQLKIFAS